MSSPSSSGDELPQRLAGALARLDAALESVEAVAAQRLERDLSFADIEEELAIMQDDRNRLAQDLDAAFTRSGAVEKMRDELLRRVERASGGIAAVLGHAPRPTGEE